MVALTQKPAKLDLEFVAGDDFEFSMRFGTRDADVVVPRDLTGCTLRAHVRDADGATPLAEFVVALDADPTTGVALASITNVQTAPLNTESRPVKLRWDCELVELNGTVRTMLAGTVSVLPQVTHG